VQLVQQKLGSALKNARLVRTSGDGLRVYEIPFVEQDGRHSYVDLGLARIDQDLMTGK